MRVGSLFSGIGGFDLGLERAGFQIVWQVESDPFCQRVLNKHWPHVTCGSDVREWSGDGHESVDLLVGGFPCQDLSVAGKRKGLAGERSGLFCEIVRIAQAIKPTWGLFENVPGLLSSHGGRDMASVLDGLRHFWPVVGYRVLDSRYFGVAQRRRRVFFACGPTEAGVEQILFEPDGGVGDSATGGEAETHVAASLRSRSHRPSVNPPGRGGENDMNIVVAHAISAHPSKRDDQAGEDYVCQALTNLGSGGPDDNEAQARHLVTHPLNQDRIYGTDAPIPVHTANDSNRARNIAMMQGVRRLTPIECARLQGFPDRWTCLCDQEPCKCPDGPQYKAYGNAVTVSVACWLGKKLMVEIRRAARRRG